MEMIRTSLQAANPLGVRVQVPRRLTPVTTRGPETRPADVGLREGAVEDVWKAARALYRTGLHPGISLVVRHRGEVVLDRAIGHRVLGGDDLITTDTPVCLFSGSKALSAVLIHRLAQDGVIGLDDTVAGYIPEFAAHGKGEVTIRDVLTHRARLWRVPLRNPRPEQLLDHEAVLAALCDARLVRSTRPAYHAITGGYLLHEIVQRTGNDLPELLERHLATPLGLTTMTYGVPEARRPEVAHNHWTGPAVLPPLTPIIRRVLGVPGHRVPAAFNLPGPMDAVLPSAGIWSSAHDAATAFQMLADGGRSGDHELLSPETMAELTRPAGPLAMDGSLPVPMRYSAGFMLGEKGPSLYGRSAPHAFGHLGFLNIALWADPSRELSVALLTTGKSAVPESLLRTLALTYAISAAIPSRPV